MVQQSLFNTMKNNKKDLVIGGLNKGNMRRDIYKSLLLFFTHPIRRVVHDFSERL
ncbi:hypothetical protein Xish_03712 [Xenorhabdus ishibashii]|uniref:Uncharacterized protein n=1 Tax=Xenorhabdus ishibashii TaxID=1034471 RepID=A0A2D0K6S4_9GAMM|nr:hypothetical protein Xish_03712 [Xenorhabdus ishibashii]